MRTLSCTTAAAAAVIFAVGPSHCGTSYRNEGRRCQSGLTVAMLPPDAGHCLLYSHRQWQGAATKDPSLLEKIAKLTFLRDQARIEQAVADVKELFSAKIYGRLLRTVPRRRRRRRRRYEEEEEEEELYWVPYVCVSVFVLCVCMYIGCMCACMCACLCAFACVHVRK